MRTTKKIVNLVVSMLVIVGASSCSEMPNLTSLKSGAGAGSSTTAQANTSSSVQTPSTSTAIDSILSNDIGTIFSVNQATGASFNVNDVKTTLLSYQDTDGILNDAEEISKTDEEELAMNNNFSVMAQKNNRKPMGRDDLRNEFSSFRKEVVNVRDFEYNYMGVGFGKGDMMDDHFGQGQGKPNMDRGQGRDLGRQDRGDMMDDHFGQGQGKPNMDRGQGKDLGRQDRGDMMDDHFGQDQGKPNMDRGQGRDFGRGDVRGEDQRNINVNVNVNINAKPKPKAEQEQFNKKLQDKKPLSPKDMKKLKRVHDHAIRKSEAISIDNGDGTITVVTETEFKKGRLVKVNKELKTFKKGEKTPLKIVHNLIEKQNKYSKVAVRVVTFDTDGSRKVTTEATIKLANGDVRIVNESKVIDNKGNGTGTAIIKVTKKDGTVVSYNNNLTISSNKVASSVKDPNKDTTEVKVEEKASGSADVSSGGTTTTVDVNIEAEKVANADNSASTSTTTSDSATTTTTTNTDTSASASTTTSDSKNSTSASAVTTENSSNSSANLAS